MIDSIKEKLVHEAKKTEREDKVGHYLTPINLVIVRVALSLAGGIISAILLMIIDTVSGIELMTADLWLLFGLILSGYYGSADEPAVTVPVNHVGVFTFLGKRHPWYVEEGSYPWYGKKLFFNISSSPLPNAVNVAGAVGEEQGFVYMGVRVLPIWNDKDSKLANISLPSRMGSNVKVRLTIRVITKNPLEWMKPDDPILQIAEQARAGLRKTVSFFRDTDAVGAKSAIADIMKGEIVLVAFTNKKLGSHLVGSIVQNKSGLPLMQTVDVDEKLDPAVIQQIVALARDRFEEKLQREGDPDMLVAAKNKEGRVEIAELSVSEKLRSIVSETGSQMLDVTISDVQLSDKVREASEAAASEGAQREGQITSAETQSEVMKVLAAGRKEAGVDDLDRLLAASADGNAGVKIVHVSGSGDRIIKAAVAGGQQIGGK